MKKRALAATLIMIFFVTVGVLCVLIYGLPWGGKVLIKTELLEEKDLLIGDEREVLFVREETLFLAWTSGAPGYPDDEGTKIRRGMQVYTIDESVPTPAGYGEDKEKSEDSENGEEAGTGEQKIAPLDEILALAGGTAPVSPGGVSDFTAIISFYGDGYEKNITPQSIDTLEQSTMNSVPSKALNLKRDYVSSGEPIYRIVDNSVWYVVLWVKSDEPVATNYETGKQLRLNPGSTEVKAVVEKIIPQGDSIMVVLRSDMYYKDLSKYRKKKIKMIFEEHKGPLVGDIAIMEKDGVTGVYAKQKDGSFKWVPVKVLRSYGGESVIAQDFFYDEEGNRVETVVYYDEIMSDPEAEGYR